MTLEVQDQLGRHSKTTSLLEIQKLHREQMRANLARALGVSPENVGVAATTTERLGWEGAGEGVGAWAVCLLERRCSD